MYQGGRASHVAKALLGVVHVADAPGKAERCPVCVVTGSDVPNTVHARCGRKNDTVEEGCVVANEEATQGVDVVRDLAPFQIGDEAAAYVQPNAEVVVVVQRGVIHAAAKVDEGDIVRCRRLLTGCQATRSVLQKYVGVAP